LLVGWLEKGELNKGQQSAVVELLLTVQNDPRWEFRWGDRLHELQHKGRLTPQQWERYVRQAFNLRLTTRRNVRRGDDLPILIEAQSGIFRYHLWSAEVSLEELTVNGRAVPLAHGSRPLWISLLRDPRADVVIPLQSLLPHLQDGWQKVDAVVSVRAGVSKYGQVIETHGPFRLVLSDNFILHPADSPTVDAVIDEQLRNQVADSLVVEPVRVGDEMKLSIKCNKPPMDVSFAVILKQSGIEHRVFSITCGRRSWLESKSTHHDLRLLEGEAEVIFRPDIKEASKTIDMTQIWGGEISFKRLVIREPASLTR
jgi:hypothetical protein